MPEPLAAHHMPAPLAGLHMPAPLAACRCRVPLPLLRNISTPPIDRAFFLLSRTN
jgi:hypothetical protein